MSREPGPRPSASDALTPDAASVARFRDDLDELGAGGEGLLVAVSGGADSVALLLLASAAIGSRCIAATVDHGLRRGSADEARQVARLCDRLGVAHTILAAPLPARAKRSANLSARARTLRYSLLYDHLRRTGAAHLATAHHADDQLETMIMRLNRAAGVSGLAGIRPRGWRIVRPLLRWRRAELAAIVASAGLTPIDDPSNADDRFDRARLRKALAGAGWLDADRWGVSALALGQAEDALDWSARRLMRENCFEEDGGLRLYLGDEPPELMRRVILLCLTRVQPDIDPRAETIQRLVKLLRATPGDPAGRRPRTTVGDVLVSTAMGVEETLIVRLRPAPPRRSH